MFTSKAIGSPSAKYSLSGPEITGKTSLKRTATLPPSSTHGGTSFAKNLLVFLALSNVAADSFAISNSKPQPQLSYTEGKAFFHKKDNGESVVTIYHNDTANLHNDLATDQMEKCPGFKGYIHKDDKAHNGIHAGIPYPKENAHMHLRYLGMNRGEAQRCLNDGHKYATKMLGKRSSLPTKQKTHPHR